MTSITLVSSNSDFFFHEYNVLIGFKRGLMIEGRGKYLSEIIDSFRLTAKSGKSYLVLVQL